MYVFISQHHHVVEHHNDVIMSVMACQNVGVAIVCSTVCSGADQRKLQSWTADTQRANNDEMFSFHDVILILELDLQLVVVRHCCLVIGEPFLSE